MGRVEVCMLCACVSEEHRNGRWSGRLRVCFVFLCVYDEEIKRES
jgi:hypothetical protein